MNRLKDKVAIVTGATSGMGWGVAELFAREGAAVVAGGRNGERGRSLVEKIGAEGGRATFVSGDVATLAGNQALVAAALEQFGGIDILVMSAGELGLGSVTEVPIETWHATVGANLHAVFYLCRLAIPEMNRRGGGSIVVNGSIAAYKGFPNHPAYCASKGALVPLVKQMARDYGPSIRVNLMCPGPVDTPLIWDSAKAFPDPDKAVQAAADGTVLKRLGLPKDVAQLTLFLASDDSAWMTGSAITIDGGASYKVRAVNFAAVDWVIVVLYLAVSLGIGIIGKRYVGDLTHFLVAGRELGVYVGIATLAATEIGTITYMYMAELGYKAGFAAFAAAIISGASMIVVGRTGFIISRFRDLKLMTVPEYFEVKYSRGLRILTGFVVALGGILNMGVFLRIEGQFLMTVSGMENRNLASIGNFQITTIVAVMTGILLLELVYTVLGGMVSVVITDFMQYILLSIATLLVSFYAVESVGGLDKVADKVASVMGPGGFSPIASPRFGFTFLVWQALLWVSLSTCWQTTAMRMFSTNSPATAKKVMTWTGLIFLGRGMLPMLWGMCALVMYGTGQLDKDGVPAPMVNGSAVEHMQAMPAMLAQILGPGVRGIVVAGMLAATMSVNSSYLLGWSSVISQDIVIPLRLAMGKGELSSTKQILINRISNVFVSLFIMFWGLYYTLPDAVYMYLGLTCTVYLSGVFVSVIGGLYWRRANVAGGYAAMIMGGVGTIVPFFFLGWSANETGFAAFGLAAIGLVVGSLLGKHQPLRVKAAAAT